jgi:hypothetical protein
MSIEGSASAFTADGVTLSTSAGVTAIKNRPFRLAADVASINGTVATGLTLALAANTNYVCRGMVVVDNTTGNNATIQQAALAAGASVVYMTAVSFKNGTIPVATSYVVATAAAVILNATLAAVTVIWIQGLVTVGANATAFALNMVDTVATDLCKAGSWIEVVPVA